MNLLPGTFKRAALEELLDFCANRQVVGLKPPGDFLLHFLWCCGERIGSTLGWLTEGDGIIHRRRGREKGISSSRLGGGGEVLHREEVHLAILGSADDAAVHGRYGHG